jgi:hypothetical protein
LYLKELDMTHVAGEPAITGTPLAGKLALLSGVGRGLGVTTTPALDVFALPAPPISLWAGLTQPATISSI